MRFLRSLQALIGCDSDGDSESIFCDSTLLRFDTFFCFSLRKFWRFQAPDSGNRAIRDSVPLPKGPKDQKKFEISSEIENSSEIEIFEPATHRGPIFCGEIETSRLKFLSEIKNFDRDQIFRSRSNIFDRWALWVSIPRYCNTIAAIPHIARYFFREVPCPSFSCFLEIPCLFPLLAFFFRGFFPSFLRTL